MADLPTHPDTGPEPPADSGGRPLSDRSRRAGALWLGLAAVLVIVVLVLHATGVVGPGGH